MNLVQVLGHSEDQPDLKNALSFKPELIDELVQICKPIRAAFLQLPGLVQGAKFGFIEDESKLVKAIDPKQIKSWQDFEFLLSLIVENRILKVFVGHLCKTQQILGLDEEKDEGLKVGKKRQKRLNKKLRKLQAFTDDETKSVKSYFDSPVGKDERDDEPVLTNSALK